jgi:hypothetical protein
MAEKQSGLSAFGEQPSPFMAEPSDLEEYQNALEGSLNALQMRYAQPNWWKVAAGFAKPQLGGFMASLGSGAEAMGENIEQQRANLLPIAQLRAQIASSKVSMGQRKKAADVFSNALGIPAEDAQKILSGQMPLPPGAHQLIRPEVVGQLSVLDPKIGAAAEKMLSAAQREQDITNKHNENLIKQYDVDVNNATLGRSQGINIPKPTLLPIGSGYNNAILAGTGLPPGAYSNEKPIPLTNQDGSPAIGGVPAVAPTSKPPALDTGKPDVAPPVGEPTKTDVSPATGIPKMKVNVISAMPKSSGPAGILSDEYVKYHQALYDAVSSGADDATKNNLMANINGLKREMLRQKITPPEFGEPTIVGTMTKPTQTEQKEEPQERVYLDSRQVNFSPLYTQKERCGKSRK